VIPADSEYKKRGKKEVNSTLDSCSFARAKSRLTPLLSSSKRLLFSVLVLFDVRTAVVGKTLDVQAECGFGRYFK
jgi:hypothetical protein